jgi:hypothetical protein
MLKVDRSEVLRHAQVGDNVLFEREPLAILLVTEKRATHHGFLRHGPCCDLDGSVCGHTSLVQCPAHFTVRDPGDVLRSINTTSNMSRGTNRVIESYDSN